MNQDKLEIIADAVCILFGISKKELKSPSRLRYYVNARSLFSYASRSLFPETPLKTIGQFLGGRDHTTVIHGINRLKDLCEAYENENDKLSGQMAMITRYAKMRINKEIEEPMKQKLNAVL